MLSYFIIIFCLALYSPIYESMEILEDSIENFYLAKYKLYQGPHQFFKKYCENPQKSPKHFFHCEIEYLWRIEGRRWEEVCETMNEQSLIPPRYYRIQLKCMSYGRLLKGLDAEWKIFQ